MCFISHKGGFIWPTLSTVCGHQKLEQRFQYPSDIYIVYKKSDFTLCFSQCHLKLFPWLSSQITFIIVAGISVCLYFLSLCRMVHCVFRNIGGKMQQLPTMPEARRRHYKVCFVLFVKFKIWFAERPIYIWWIKQYSGCFSTLAGIGRV